MLQEPRDLLERHRIDQIEHAVDILQVRLQVTLVRAAEEHERVAILVALDQRHVIADAPAPERRVRARAGINADDRLALRLQPRAQRLQLRARHESLDQFRQFRPVIGNRDAVRREDALGQLAEHRLLVEQRIVFDAQRERRALERRPETRAARRHARDQLGYAVVLVVIDREVVAARPEEPPAQIRQRAHERRRRDEDRADERQLGEQRGVGAIGRHQSIVAPGNASASCRTVGKRHSESPIAESLMISTRVGVRPSARFGCGTALTRSDNIRSSRL